MAEVTVGVCATLLRGNVYVKRESCLWMTHPFLYRSLDYICFQRRVHVEEFRRTSVRVQNVLFSPHFPKGGTKSEVYFFVSLASLSLTSGLEAPGVSGCSRQWNGDG